MDTLNEGTLLFLQGPPEPLFRIRPGGDRGLRVHRIYICGGSLRDWPDSFRRKVSDRRWRRSRGNAWRSPRLVCVNSTSATLALARHIPVCTIAEAVSDMPWLSR